MSGYTYFCSIFNKNWILADFHIHMRPNDMKIVVQKINLGAQILYRSLVPSKKRRHWHKIVRNRRQRRWATLWRWRRILSRSARSWLRRTGRSWTRTGFGTGNDKTGHKNRVFWRVSTNFRVDICTSCYIVACYFTIGSKITILIENGKFSRKWKFWSKVEIFVDKLKLWLKVKILVEKRKINRKIELLVKHRKLILDDWNFGQKSKS